MKRRKVVMIVAVGLLLGAAPLSAAPLNVNVGGSNATVRTTEPGLSCADDGKGSYRHFFAEADLASGVMSSLAGDARTTLDVHYDGPAVPPGPGPGAYLLSSESHVTLSNQRGSVQIALRSGACPAPTVNFNGTTASLAKPGTWVPSDVIGTGAYRQVTGSGTYGFTAETNPGADNAWSLQLDGSLNVLQPALRARVERVFWGNLGLDYASRVVTVVFRIANAGPGDSFAARFKQASTPTSGVTVCRDAGSTLNPCPAGSPPEQLLGDLGPCADPALPATCDSELLSVRYRLGLLQPCALVLLGCRFKAALRIGLPDALDISTDATVTLDVRAPNLPPPL
ncbi:MAG: hypothetical protein ACRD0F_02465 [Acidimicrobiales bacterium]